MSARDAKLSDEDPDAEILALIHADEGDMAVYGWLAEQAHVAAESWAAHSQQEQVSERGSGACANDGQSKD